MDLEILKKKISSYRTEGGHLTKITDALAVEILSAWEQWTGPAKGFYSAIGVNQHKLATIIGKGKKLKRDGFPSDNFKEVKLIGVGESATGQLPPCSGVEIAWDGGRLIRFTAVDQLVDFLKKVA